MGIVGEIEFILAGVENVAFVRLVIVGGKLISLHGQCDGLGSAGRELRGLGERSKNYLCLLNSALCVRSFGIELYDLLSGCGAGIRNLDLEGVHTVGVGGRAVKRHIERGITQTVSKRIDNRAVIVEAGIVALRGFVSGGFIVAIADIDALFVFVEAAGFVAADGAVDV